MKIVCKKNILTGSELKEVTPHHINEYKYDDIYIGGEYLVMGVMINSFNCLYYLIDTYEDIVDKFNRPSWYPYLLFDISNTKLSKTWYARTYDKNESINVVYLSGFEELINDYHFYDALIDRDEAALKTYQLRKIKLLQELYESNK